MVKINDLISKKSIPKVVDPGSSATSFQEVSKEVEKPTEISSLFTDISDTALSVNSLVDNTINEIITYNNSDPDFNEYVNLVKENYIDPENLAQYETYTPKNPHGKILVKERIVYQNLTDPRASFIRDLFNIKYEVGSIKVVSSNIEFILKDTRRDIAESSSFDVLRLFLAKNNQHLERLRNDTQRISNNRVARIANGIITAFINKVYGRISAETNSEKINKINEVLRSLRQLRTVLEVALITENKDWERFQDDILSVYGDYIGFVSNQIVASNSFILFNKAQNSVFDLIDGIDSDLSLNLDLSSIPEVTEFVRQIDGAFFRSVADMQDQLLYSESNYARLQESRAIMLSNSQKKSKTLQYVQMCTSLIENLEAIKSMFSVSQVNDIRNLETKVRSDISKYITTIRRNNV